MLLLFFNSKDLKKKSLIIIKNLYCWTIILDEKNKFIVSNIVSRSFIMFELNVRFQPEVGASNFNRSVYIQNRSFSNIFYSQNLRFITKEEEKDQISHL